MTCDLKQATREPAFALLVEQVLPRVLALRGAHVIHAATLSTPRGAIMLCGGSGRGKSTLGSYLETERGWPLLGDDLAIVVHKHDAWHVDAPVPGAKVWSDTLAEVCALGIKAVPIPAYESKYRVLPAPGDQPDRRHSLPLAGIFQLYKAPPVDSCVRATAGEPRPMDRAMLLSNNSFRMDREDPATQARVLHQCCELARDVDVVRLIYRRAWDQLPCVADLIEAHLGL